MDTTTGQEPAAELPDGWAHEASGRARWLSARIDAASGPTTVYAYPVPGELDVSVCGPLTPAEARALAARLLEGAALAERCSCRIAVPAAGWEMRSIDSACPRHSTGGVA
jgi:hypothetical protein